MFKKPKLHQVPASPQGKGGVNEEAFWISCMTNLHGD